MVGVKDMGRDFAHPGPPFEPHVRVDWVVGVKDGVEDLLIQVHRLSPL